MVQQIKYTHEELVKAVKRIQDLGDYDQEVDASRKAGEILNAALNDLEKGVSAGVARAVAGESGEKQGENFDNSDFKL